MASILRTTLLALALAGCAAQREPARDSTHGAARDSANVAGQPAALAALSSDSVVVAPADTGVRVDASGRLVLPIVFPAACEGEDCQSSFGAFVCLPAELHSAPAVSAPVVARLAHGDSVAIARTDLHLLRPGIVVVKRPLVIASDAAMEDNHPVARKDTLRFATGDTLYLLHYELLGDWLWWSRGKVAEGSQFWGAPEDEKRIGDMTTDTTRAVARSQPQLEWWWLVGGVQRPRGWWLADSLGSLRSVRDMEYWAEYCPASHPGEPGGPPR